MKKIIPVIAIIFFAAVFVATLIINTMMRGIISTLISLGIAFVSLMALYVWCFRDDFFTKKENKKKRGKANDKED